MENHKFQLGIFEGDIEKLISNTKKIQKLINWQPKYDDLNTIIKSSILWERKLNDEIL